MQAFLHAQLPCFLGGNQTFFNRFLANDFRAHATAIVLNLDHNVITSLRSGKIDNTFGIFAAGCAICNGFNTMVHRIAHQVDQGVIQLFENGFVHLGFRTFNHQFNVFAQLTRNITGQATVFLEYAAHWLHTGLHHSRLQIGNQHIKLANYRVKRLDQFFIAGTGCKSLEKAVQAVFGQTDFTAEVQDLIKTRGVHTNGIFFLYGCCRLSCFCFGWWRLGANCGSGLPCNCLSGHACA